MKIKAFKAEALHGYLSLSPAFFPDLTFLTGINGSGKTSVIQGIAALLTPSFQLLHQWDFLRLQLEVEHKSALHTIFAVKHGDGVSLGIDNTEPLTIPRPPDELAHYRGLESPLDEFYDGLIVKFTDTPVIKLLRSLPTPMILGIDRRGQEPLDPTVVRRRYARSRMRPFDIFGHTLENSIREAVGLTETKFREIEVQRSRSADRLREQIILNALEYSYSPNIGKLEAPSIRDSLALSTRAEDAIQTLKDLGIPEENVRTHLTSFFSKLSEVAQQIPQDVDIAKIKEPEILNTLFQWLINKPQFDRIEKILRLVDQHVKDVATIRKPIEHYREAVNAFLADSGKEILFNARGDLCVQIHGQHSHPLTGLSSGENQLVVILSHLSFSPAARTANVIIVDEPELSLHVKWQEAFVEAIQKTNPRLQIILATHSPSIVLDRIDKCIDLSSAKD
jgi:energy-coupling factor transporter ATP-binding protein EcfA2